MSGWSTIYNVLVNNSISYTPTSRNDFCMSCLNYTGNLLFYNFYTAPYTHFLTHLPIYAEFFEFGTITILNRSCISGITQPAIYGIWFYHFIYKHHGDPNVRLGNLNMTQFYEHYYTNECFHYEVFDFDYSGDIPFY